MELGIRRKMKTEIKNSNVIEEALTHQKHNDD